MLIVIGIRQICVNYPKHAQVMLHHYVDSHRNMADLYEYPKHAQVMLHHYVDSHWNTADLYEIS